MSTLDITVRVVMLNPRSKAFLLALILPRSIFTRFFGLFLVSTSSWAASVDAVDFQREVRPILSDNCFSCHGPDAQTRMAALRLDTRDGAFAARGSKSPLVPGDTDASLLYQRITTQDPARRMPPTFSKKELTKKQIDLLRRWIEEGASWDQHWSFKAIQPYEPPAVENESWVRSPLDRFILARLEKEGLEPAPEADRRTLARRVALDLTGLPPDPGTLESYLNDSSAQSYEKLVDKLLASKHWGGEHRARYWLDAARYADTHGIHIDNYREMWPYRDWVIRALNENKPFDEFTVEQIAGDLLPSPTLDQLVATGFHRCNITTNEGGVIPEEYEAIYAKDRADTTGTVFLGLTVGCATCHDHKFDPIAQSEFYSLTAFFRNTTQYVMDGNISDPPPTLVVPSEEDRGLWTDLRQEAAELEVKIASRANSVGELFAAWLAAGRYCSLSAPLEESAELLTLVLDGDPVVNIEGSREKIALNQGAVVAEGPHPNQPALRFKEESWAELPPLNLDTDNPFSMALWIYQPKVVGNFTVAAQDDPEDHSRGWTLSIQQRQLTFALTGEKPAGGDSPSAVKILPINTKRMPPGIWTHIVVTHDGSGERGGLRVYRNGDLVEEQGSEFFAKVEGSIRTGLPLQLGRGFGKSSEREDAKVRHFSGGGIADLRFFNRPITVQEAKIVSLWHVLQIARDQKPEQLSEDQQEALRLYYLSVEDTDYRRLLARKQAINREWREIRRRGGVTHVMQENPDSDPVAHVLHRGMYDQPRQRVPANTPAALHPMPASFPRNRMGLARWLVDDANPLTSRVIVNRYWQEVFGTGLVRTSDDFGSQGEPPSHPELIDWLALDFRQSGWDIKQFFRRLVTSSTYRQSARATPEKLEQDPENRLLSRGPLFRLDGEMIRDYALAASGLVVRKIGGPSVKPYQPAGVWKTVAMPSSNTQIYQRDSGSKLYRRSMYTFWKRSAPPASMDIFNAPTREHATVRRERTNTPMQALVTMNDTQFVEASRFLAQRAMREAGDGFDRRLDFVTTRLLARPFSERERAVAKRTYEGFIGFYRSNTGEAKKLLSTGETPPDEALSSTQSAAWTMLASQIMNLDEVLNR